MDIDDKIFHGIFHFNRLKQPFLRKINGTITTLEELEKKLGIRISGKK